MTEAHRTMERLAAELAVRNAQAADAGDEREALRARVAQLEEILSRVVAHEDERYEAERRFGREIVGIRGLLNLPGNWRQKEQTRENHNGA